MTPSDPTTEQLARSEALDPEVDSRDAGPWDDWPWERILAWAGLLVVAACCAFVFLQLRPELLFRDTTPSGGDTAAHVWWPAYLRDHLLPWRLAGWSPDFYAGFPAGQFYFPVPALLIVGLDIVLPYNVAFKLITALGPVLLPLGAYIFARGIRAPRPTPAAFAVAATAFLFFTGDPGSTSAAQSIAFNQHIMGGTLASTLAGEFSFTIALACALAFLGTFAYSLRTGRRMWLPAVLLAATVMSHLVVGIFVALGVLVVWLGSRPLKTLGRAAAIGVVGFFLSALWLFPLLATLGYTTDMRYGAITQYTNYLFPSYIVGVHGALPWEWGAYALIAIAAVGAIIEKQRSTFQLVVLTSLAGLVFRLWESLQSTTVWNLRLLPFWYICVFLLMATGVAEVLRGLAWLTKRVASWWQGTPRSEDFDPVPAFRPRRRIAPSTIGAACLVALTVASSVVVLLGIRDAEAFLPDWISWNYRGYQDTVGDAHAGPKSYAEYQAFIKTAGALPPGRLLWEGNQQLDAYGSPLALMLLPYWTHGRIASMEGVYYEASATTPYHFIATSTIDGPGNASNAVGGISYGTSADFSSRGVPYLELLGVRYLAVHSTEAKASAAADARLRLVATVPDLDNKAPSGWNIFEVRDAPLVAPLSYQPVVVDHLSASDQRACRKRVLLTGIQPDALQIHDWQDCIGVPWFSTVANLDRPLVDAGPSAWRHLGSEAALVATKRTLPAVTVSRIKSTDDTVSFHVSRTGVPVYVKTSWFPNWQADGAAGPYRATPNFMVVVPTSKDVTLRYGTTTPEWVGRVATGLGILGVVALAVVPWRRRRSRVTVPTGTPSGSGPGDPGYGSGERDQTENV